MNSIEKKMELILAYLLGRPSAATHDLPSALEQLATDPEMQNLLERVESLVSQRDDSAWLEAIAAYSEGVMMPEVVEFINDRDVLAQLDPELVAQFDALLVGPSADELDIFPKFPGLAEQFQAQSKKNLPVESDQIEETSWHGVSGFAWRQIKETGQTTIRLAAEAFDTSVQTVIQALQPPASPLAYPGRRRGKQNKPFFQIDLKEAVEDLALKIVAESQWEDSNLFTITVEVDIASRGGWPYLGNTEVALKRDDLTFETKITDPYGKAVFKDIGRHDLPKLAFEITPH